MTPTAEALVTEFLAALNAATEAARRSVLDGTLSCGVCRALVLDENSDAHRRWHITGASR